MCAAVYRQTVRARNEWSSSAEMINGINKGSERGGEHAITSSSSLSFFVVWCCVFECRRYIYIYTQTTARHHVYNTHMSYNTYTRYNGHSRQTRFHYTSTYYISQYYVGSSL